MSKYAVIIYAECDPALTRVAYFDIFEDVVGTLSNFEDYIQ